MCHDIKVKICHLVQHDFSSTLVEFSRREKKGIFLLRDSSLLITSNKKKIEKAKDFFSHHIDSGHITLKDCSLVIIV